MFAAEVWALIQVYNENICQSLQYSEKAGQSQQDSEDTGRRSKGKKPKPKKKAKAQKPIDIFTYILQLHKSGKSDGNMGRGARLEAHWHNMDSQSSDCS